MSAAAQTARRNPPREKPDKVPLPAWFLDSLDSGGFMAVPVTAIENLDRKLEPVARSIYLNLLRATAGNWSQGRPQQVRITYEEFAEWANCTTAAVKQSLRFLREHKVIGADGDPRNRNYVVFWITDFSLARLPDRDPKTNAEGARKPLPWTGPPLTLSDGGRWKSRFEQPATIDEISFRHQGDDLEVQHKLHGSHLELITKTRLNGSKQLPESKGTGVPLSAQLKAELTPIFLQRFSHAPDKALLKEIAAALGDCPVDYYLHVVVHPRLASNYKVRPKLFVNLAHDATTKWAQVPDAVRQVFLRPLAEAPAIASVAPAIASEPEDSASPWMQIRLALKARIHPTEYENWFAHTAFAALKSGELVVRTGDQVTADFIAQEYGATILTTATELGLAVTRVRYLPPEEPSS